MTELYERYTMYINRGIHMAETIISKWGNSLGFRIPNSIVKSLKLKEGDKLSIKEFENSFSVSKKTNNTVEEILCNFYGKSIDEILKMNIKDSEEELDWGIDVGSEVIK